MQRKELEFGNNTKWNFPRYIMRLFYAIVPHFVVYIINEYTNWNWFFT